MSPSNCFESVSLYGQSFRVTGHFEVSVLNNPQMTLNSSTSVFQAEHGSQCVANTLTWSVKHLGVFTEEFRRRDADCQLWSPPEGHNWSVSPMEVKQKLMETTTCCDIGEVAFTAKKKKKKKKTRGPGTVMISFTIFQKQNDFQLMHILLKFHFQVTFAVKSWPDIWFFRVSIVADRRGNKMPYMWSAVGHRAKRTEIWGSGTLVTHILDTFGLLVFMVNTVSLWCACCLLLVYNSKMADHRAVLNLGLWTHILPQTG